MELTNVQIVTNEDGEQTAVLVPIEVWREIAERLSVPSPFDLARLRASGATDAYITLEETKRRLGLGEDFAASAGDGA